MMALYTMVLLTLILLEELEEVGLKELEVPQFVCLEDLEALEQFFWLENLEVVGAQVQLVAPSEVD